ncbi:MAG: tripartite tricarboxylate transporter permease, partial [Propionibacteriaceae bacterium]|nr:tripartite tricarboxylate transporter permease [Propionibacteriaceae bacterium]
KLNEALRNATFLSRVDKTANDGAFRFAHTSLQEFFLSEYLLRALRDDAPERWAMRVPSRETLDFLGQSLAETGGRQELATMARWFRGDNQAVNTDILAYRWQASWKGWPQVDLPVLFVDEGATSETIAPGEKVLLGGNVWRVLEVKEKAGTALLLSERVVAYRAYHAEFTEITWEKCTLRDWLNHDFVRSLPADFADLIVETPNENVDNPTYGTSGGRSTRDKVFLLSLEEVERYSTNSKASRVATRHDGDTWWWWLRSPGGGGSLAALVSYDGTVYDFGDNVTDAAGGVRPALTIRIPRS